MYFFCPGRCDGWNSSSHAPRPFVDVCVLVRCPTVLHASSLSIPISSLRPPPTPFLAGCAARRRAELTRWPEPGGGRLAGWLARGGPDEAAAGWPARRGTELARRSSPGRGAQVVDGRRHAGGGVGLAGSRRPLLLDSFRWTSMCCWFGEERYSTGEKPRKEEKKSH
jgi:hypothetical protein